MFASKGQFHGLKRREFVKYFKWAVRHLPNLHFQSNVNNIDYSNGCFEVFIDDRLFLAKNLVMGAGLSAFIPEFCRPFLGPKVIHSSQFLTTNIEHYGKRIMVVGGGQSGAEVVLHLLKDEDRLPQSIKWVSSSYNFLTLESIPFSNELYTPNYIDYFYSLHKDDKIKLLEKQKFTSDSISEKTLADLYEILYNYKCLKEVDVLEFYPGSYLTGLEPNGDSFAATITLKEQKSAAHHEEVDIVVLSTGFNYQPPKCIKPLMPYLSIKDGKFDVAEDFSIIPQKEMNGKIYLHNGARHVRGVLTLT